jgi:crotonobetainyl-CoA:carnitine CoA-transferase CaiB-like acyl-CoA transferase
VETSLVRAAIYALGSDMAIQLRFGKLASTRPREGAINPIANFFRTKDERWVCVLPRQSEKDWGIMCDALDAGHLKTDPRFIKSRDRRANGPALVAEIDTLFATKDLADIAERFDKGDLVWAPFNTPAEASVDPQLIAAGCYVDTPMASGEGTFRAPAAPARFHGADDGPKGPSPRPGQHTSGVLAGAGFSADEVAAMLASGAAA